MTDMKRLFILVAAVSLAAPVSSFGQAPKVTQTEDENTITIVEETLTENGRIVTTTTLEKNSVFTNGFWHNWEISAGAGPHLYIGENDWKVGKKTEMITFPAIDLYLTKWASPSFGVGLGFTAGNFKGLYQTLTVPLSNEFAPVGNFQQTPVVYYTKADHLYDYQGLAVQKGFFLNTYALAHADLFNIFGGYKPDRIFDIDAYMGGGVIFGFQKKGTVPGATFNAGLTNKLRLTEQLKLMLNVRGALISDDFDGETYISEPTEKHWQLNHKVDGNFGVTLGLAYNIGKEYSKWRLAERVSKYEYVKEEVEKFIHDTVYVKDPIIIKEVPEVWFHINFIVDRWDISKKELINIHAVSDLIKSTPNTKYLVCGYADKQTATPAHNLMLSENRAKAVYNVMVNEFGVNPNQLVMDYKGGVDYMFYNMKELSRCVMITAIHEE